MQGLQGFRYFTIFVIESNFEKMENENDARGFEPTIKGRFVARHCDKIRINENEIDQMQDLTRSFVNKVVADIDMYTSIAIYSAVLAIEGVVLGQHITAISAFKELKSNGHVTLFRYNDMPIFSRDCEYPNAPNALKLTIEFQFEKPEYGFYFDAERAKEITGI